MGRDKKFPSPLKTKFYEDLLSGKICEGEIKG
jgi:hypothetical protein